MKIEAWNREKEKQVAESQRKVREAEEKISNAINSMPHGITMWDKDMKLVRINDFGNRIWKKGKINLKAGSSYEDYMRQSKKNNFLAAINVLDDQFGLSLLDVSTGDFFLSRGSLNYILNLMKMMICLLENCVFC